jgi:peptidylprolyl isomerase
MAVKPDSLVGPAAAAIMFLATPPASMALTAPTPDCLSPLKTDTSGLQWCVVREATADAPNPVKGSMIKAHYAGKLYSSTIEGTFDSSYDRGRPLSFAVGTGQVIRGWDLGILGDASTSLPAMKKGEVRRLVIPPQLGYGDRTIGPILDFVVEYLGRLGEK